MDKRLIKKIYLIKKHLSICNKFEIMKKELYIKIRLIETEQEHQRVGTESYQTVVDVPDDFDMLNCLRLMQRYFSKVLGENIKFD